MKKIKNRRSCRGGIVINLNTYNFIPNNVFAYWVSKNFISVLQKSKPLYEFGEPKKGLSTGDNEKFLRLWFEVSIKKECFNATDIINAFAYGSKWYPLNKGGSFRKWYGNNEYVINYENNGRKLKEFDRSVIRNEKYYFRESITWSMLSSTTLGMRYSQNGKIFEGAGPSLFVDNNLEYLLGLTCSKIGVYFSKALNPTLNINISDIGNIPIIETKSEYDNIRLITKNNIKISKDEWDSFETSWDFKKHPLI